MRLMRLAAVSVCLLSIVFANLRALAGESSPIIHTLQDHKGSVMSQSFSPDGERLATSSRDGTIKIWSVSTGKLERTLTGHTEDVYRVTYSPDGTLLASGSGDKTVRLWDATTFETIRILNGHTDVVRWVTFSHDGKTLVSVGADRMIRFWNVATGDETKVLRGHTDVVKMATFSPDGHTLVTTGVDGTVRTWDIATGEPLATLRGHTSSIEGVAVSPDGKLYASSSNDNTVRIWDAQSATPLHLLLGHSGEVDSVTFAHDSITVISGGRDKTIRFWNACTGEQLHTLTGHTGRVESMEISGDGKLLATGGGGGDTAVRIWDLTGIPFAQRSDAPVATIATHDIPFDADAPETRAAEIDQLWRLLGNDDGDDSGVAQRRLVALGDSALSRLSKRLTPLADPIDPNWVRQQIAQLDDPNPAVREIATCNLIQAGPAIEPLAREALKIPASPIARHRLEMILHDFTALDPETNHPAATVLRRVNAVKALKEINTPAALDFLAHLESAQTATP